MYYYGYNGGYGNAPYYQNPCNTSFVGYTQGGGYGFNAALWIVLFILLVIIIGAGLFREPIGGPGRGR